jgi:hypothetical protein
LEVPQSAGWISGKRYSFHPGSLPHFKAVLVPEFPIELFDPTMQFEEITIHSVCPNSGVDMAEPLRLHVKRGVDKKGDKTGSIRISQKDKVMFSLVNCLHEVFIDATAALVERAGAAMGTSFTGSHLLNGKG